MSLDPREVWRIARDADAWWLAASVVPLGLRFALWGLKAGRMFRREGPVPRFEPTRGVLAGAFLNLVTPTARIAGGVYRAASMRRATGWRFSTAYGCVFADQITNLVGSLALFGGLALAAAPLAGHPSWSAAFRVSGAAALALVAAYVLGRRFAWAWIHRPRVRRWLTRFRPLLSTRAPDDPDRRPWFESWLAPALAGREGRAALTSDLVLSALSWSTLCVSNALVFRSIGVEAPFALLATSLVLGTFAGGVVGMGGIGLTEAALVGLYTQLGISGPEAGAAALLHRAGYYSVIALFGGWAFARPRRTRDAPRVPSPPRTISDAPDDAASPD